MKQAGLSIWKKLQFSLASFGVNLIGITLSSWLLYFYSPPADAGRIIYLDNKLVGVLLAIASIWDSIIDPVIGQISDNTRHRLGRRKPFLLIGAPIEVVALVLLFLPPNPNTVGSAVIAIFLFLMRTIFFTAHSLVCIPYDGLIAEMTDVSTERVQLSSFKNIFGLIGTLLGTVLAGTLFEISPVVMAAVIGIIGLLTIYGAIPAIKERAIENQAQIPVYQGIKLALKNTPFLILSVTALIYMFCQNLLMANNSFAVVSGLGQDEGMAGLYVAVMVVVMILSAVIWSVIAKKASAIKLYKICMAGMAVGAVIAFLTNIVPLPPVAVFLAGMIVMGPFLGGQMIFSFSIMGAVVNYDEKLNNCRREALFYGVFSLASGVGTSLAIFVLPFIHSTFGNTRDHSLGTTVPFMIIALISIVSLLIFSRFNLDDEGNIGGK